MLLGCKRSFGPREKDAPKSHLRANKVCARATPCCASAMSLLFLCPQRPFVPSPNHFGPDRLIWLLSLVAWFAATHESVHSSGQIPLFCFHLFRLPQGSTLWLQPQTSPTSRSGGGASFKLVVGRFWAFFCCHFDRSWPKITKNRLKVDYLQDVRWGVLVKRGEGLWLK